MGGGAGDAGTPGTLSEVIGSVEFESSASAVSAGCGGGRLSAPAHPGASHAQTGDLWASGDECVYVKWGEASGAEASLQRCMLSGRATA